MNNGEIKFGEDFVVNKNYTLQAFKVVEKKYCFQPVVINGLFESYRADSIEFYGKKIRPTLYFENGHIVRLSIYFVSNEHGWAEDAKDKEKKKKHDQDHWLTSILKQSSPYVFNWGKIESVFDPRSCCSSIIISFVK